MSRLYSWVLAIVVLLFAGGVWLVAAPTVSSPSANPSSLPANMPVAVTFTMKIDDNSVVPTGVNLLRLAPNGTSVIAATMRDDGMNGDIVASDKTFTARVTLNENTPGNVRFRVSAAFRGVLARVLSPIIPVLILTPPTGFAANLAPLLAGGPLAFNNFGGLYGQGGTLPPGGAEIDVTRVPLPPPPLSDFIALETRGSTITLSDVIVVSGISCARVYYTDVYTPTMSLKNLAVYCPSGNILFKFYLSYLSGDSNESQLLLRFQQFLNGANLTF